MDRDILERALDLDFEDAVFHEAARHAAAAALVTRDGVGFAEASVLAVDLHELTATRPAAAAV